MNGRATSTEEYAGFVDQVIGELQDMLDTAGFDFDDVESNTDFINVLLREMREMRATMADCSYQFGRNDLPVMPFIRLFYDINRTHR